MNIAIYESIKVISLSRRLQQFLETTPMFVFCSNGILERTEVLKLMQAGNFREKIECFTVTRETAIKNHSLP